MGCEQHIVGGGDDDRPGRGFGRCIDAVGDIVGGPGEAHRQARCFGDGAQIFVRARLDRDADVVESLDLGQRGEDMGKQRPAADRHQAFVGHARLLRQRVEPAVPLGGQDDDGEAVLSHPADRGA